MGPVKRWLYQHVPSFKREHGGLYATYAAVHSRIYATRMRYLHRRGQHDQSPHGRCQWCGQTAITAQGVPSDDRDTRTA